MSKKLLLITISLALVFSTCACGQSNTEIKASSTESSGEGKASSTEASSSTETGSSLEIIND